MGYYLSKGLKFNEKTARTVSIETGILPDNTSESVSTNCVAYHNAWFEVVHCVVMHLLSQCYNNPSDIGSSPDLVLTPVTHGMPCWCLAGMQSAALGFALAQKHFSDVMVCVPAAVSVVFMALGGSALAVFWRSRPATD